MADASEMAAKLKRFAGHIELDENNHLGYDDAQCIRMVASLIERLTKPMTAKQAAEYMNEIKFNAVDDWKEAVTASDGSFWVESNWINYGFPDWAAIAIVRAHEARKEAGVG